MHFKRNILLSMTLLVLAVPLMFVPGNACAAVFTFDGASHDSASGAWVAPTFADTYCAAPPKDPATGNEWDGLSFNGVPLAIPNAVKRVDLTPQQCNGPATSSQVIAGVFTGSYSVNSSHVVSSTPGPIAAVGAAFPAASPTAKADCIAAGYTWSVNLADSLRSTCKAFSWEADVASGNTSTRGPGGWYGENRQGCLRCHNTAYMSAMNGVYPSKGNSGDISSFGKESYLLGGHRNMSRPADGLNWTMPGVDAGHPASPWLSDASLDSNGIFTSLWLQEDYPRMTADWTNKTVSLGYCAKSDGTIGSGDVPDLKACPTCESPVMGNGAAGYPLNYPDEATCRAAKNPSGTADYTWVSYAPSPIYWIYGGAGLEGGPAMLQQGSQQYKCGRCHTTGWTGNNLTDAAVSGPIGTKHPWSDGLPTSATVIGGATKLTKTSTSTSYDYSSWDQWGIECSRCHQNANGSHDQWPTGSTTGGDIVALCMNCHRQESDTAPRVGTTANAATPYTNKQQQPDGFAHHPDGNEFLNSPHSKFTGTWGQIGCPPYAINGYTSYVAGSPAANLLNPGAPTDCTPGAMNVDGSTPSPYASNFARAALVDLGTSTAAAGSCVTCHDVHKTKNENTPGMSAGAVVACANCHMKGAGSVSPQVNLSIINHPTGTGTPLENIATNPSSACIICHQPAGIMHIWRVNTDANYTTFGNYTHTDPPSGNVNPSNTALDRLGTYPTAVWLDIDSACGQCHGGGVSQTDVSTTLIAPISGQTYSVVVNNVKGFASGKEITITGAGQAGGDFKTIIASVSGYTVYLTYPTPAAGSAYAGTTVVTVAGNPTANGASYKTKTALSLLAKNMHSAEPKALFTWKMDASTNLKINFDASSSYCPPAATSCDYAWSFGDALSSTGTGSSVSFTYSDSTAKTVSLTVRAIGLGTRDVRTLTVAPRYAGAASPIVFSAPTVTVTGFTAHLTSVITGGSGTITAKVAWGDGKADIVTGNPLTSVDLSHVYPRARTTAYPYRLIILAADSGVNGRYRSVVNTAKTPVHVAINPLTISGLVTKNTDSTYTTVTSFPSVVMSLKQGTKTVKRAITDSNGRYTFTNVVPNIVSGPTTSATPYTVTPSRAGYTFAPSISADITIAPDLENADQTQNLVSTFTTTR
jgi:hypothetical protein